MAPPDSNETLRFRPRLVPAILTLLGLAILLNLGFWQLRRLHEKERLIALATKRVRLAPVTLAQAMARPNALAWRRVRAAGVYAREETLFVFERDPEAAPEPAAARQRGGGTPAPARGARIPESEAGGGGYRVLTPLRAEGLPSAKGMQAAILVDRGWIPESEQPGFLQRDPRRGRVELIASFVPLEDEPPPSRAGRRHRLFATFRLSSMRAQVPFPLVPALLVRGDAPDGDLPRGEWAVPRMKVDHRQYALTWFALAALLVVVFVAGSRKRIGNR